MNEIIQKMDILMKGILETRYSDIDKEYQYCLELLSFGEKMNSIYAKAFAYAYLGDYYLANTDTKNSGENLFKAKQLCSRVTYPELYMRICHLIGFHYYLIADEQNELEYYIEAADLAKELNDAYQQSKTWNNIASMYGTRGALEESKRYYIKTYEAMIENKSRDTRGMTIILYSLTSVSIQQKDSDAMLEYSDAIQKLDTEKTPFYLLYCHCTRIMVEAYMGHENMVLSLANDLLNQQFYNIKEKYTIIILILSVTESLVNYKMKQCAKRYLQLLEEFCSKDENSFVEELVNLQIKYAEAFMDDKHINESYKRYYQAMQKNKMAEDESRIKEMNAKFRMHEIMHNQDTILKENKRLAGEAYVDELTNLYNRRFFNNKLKSVQANDLKSIGIIMIDVDYFKQYNDNYGHFHGDFILREIGKILKNCDDKNIIPFRYGGDEFICICRECTDTVIESYIHKVRNEVTALKIKHEYSACSSYISLSIGYTNHLLNHSLDMDDLLNQADEALYHAKSMGRNRYQSYKDMIVLD